jgi:tetratricopeptide (TPR) repeat protein
MTATVKRTAAAVERELLARLGLRADASSQDVESAHDQLIEYLEQAPADLRSWARREITRADEAYALLSDPTIDRSALAGTVVVAAPAPVPATTAARVAAPSWGPATRPTAVTGNPLVRRVAIGAAVIVGAVAIALAGYNMNGGTGIPPINGTPAPDAAASPAVDAAQVTALMQKIQVDPKDIASLQSLADLYYQAGDFKTAGTFLEKILAIDSKNVTALLALGAAQFNEGDSADAEKQWRAVLAIDAQNVEAHYDLGFMYLSMNPPDVANVKLEWGQVIAIDPNSDVAKTVATHLASIEGSPAPSASAAPSAAPTGSAAPASPAAPTGSAAPVSPAASASPAAPPAASPSPSGS